MNRSIPILSIALFLAHSVPGNVNAGPLNFSVVVSTGDTIDGKVLTDFTVGFGIGGPLSLNNNQNVAFSSSYVGGTGIFTRDRIVAEFGSTIDGQTLSNISIGSHALNDNDDVAFLGFVLGGNRAVFTQNGLLTVTGDSIGGKALGQNIGTPSINNNGDVAFTAAVGAGAKAVFTQNAVLASTGDVIDGRTLGPSIGDPVINNNGDAAFFAVFGGGSGDFTQNGFIAQTNSLALDFNDNGDLVFFSQNPSNGVRALNTPTELIVTPGDVVSGMPLTFLYPEFALNNSGLVTFHADFAGGSGIFSTDEILIATGDIIDGRTVTGIGRHSLNDNGDLAVFASFSDGSTGIILGQAASVPEPPSLLLLAFGAIGLVAYRWRRKADCVYPA